MVSFKTNFSGHLDVYSWKSRHRLKQIVPRSLEIDGGFNPLNEKSAQVIGSSSLSFGMKIPKQNTLKPPSKP